MYVFATVLMLAAGLRKTLVATREDDNVVVIRRVADRSAERVDRAQAALSRACRRSRSARTASAWFRRRRSC